MTRVLLADVHRSFVEALAMLLATEPGIQIVAAVTRPDEALGVVRSRSVDVAVVRVDGGRDDYLSIAPALLAVRPHLKLVAVAEEDDVAVLARALRGGFRAWVPKSGGVAALVEVLSGVLREGTYVPPLLLTRLLPHLLQENEEQCAVQMLIRTLTARERQVLGAMVSGSTRQEIAEDLQLSANTVRTHIQNVLSKLGVHTSLAAVTLARRAGSH